MTLKAEIDEFMGPDPFRAVRVGTGMLLVQSVGALLAAGATVEDVRECVEEALTMALRQMAATRPNQTAGQILDAAMSNGAMTSEPPKKIIQ